MSADKNKSDAARITGYCTASALDKGRGRIMQQYTLRRRYEARRRIGPRTRSLAARDIFAHRLAFRLGFFDLHFHDVADRDHGDDLAALAHRHVAEPPLGHDRH